MKLRLSELVGAALAEGGLSMRVTAKNVAAYAIDPFSPDLGLTGAGDADPAFTLQTGDVVVAQGTTGKNAHGVAYLPVAVNGRQGMFFVRASSVTPATSSTPGSITTTTTTVMREPIPWWQWLLLAVGGSVAAYGGYRLIKERRR